MTHFFYVARCVVTIRNVLDRTDEAQNSPKCANDDCLNAQYPDEKAHGSGMTIYANIALSSLLNLTFPLS